MQCVEYYELHFLWLSTEFVLYHVFLGGAVKSSFLFFTFTMMNTRHRRCVFRKLNYKPHSSSLIINSGFVEMKSAQWSIFNYSTMKNSFISRFSFFYCLMYRQKNVIFFQHWSTSPSFSKNIRITNCRTSMKNLWNNFVFGKSKVEKYFRIREFV